MRHIINRHKVLWSNKVFPYLAFDGVLFLAASLVVNYFAGTYASERAGNSVTDIFLDNLPTWNVNFIFIDGFILFILFITALVLHQPKKIPFVLKTVALFTFTRAMFMTLTHIGPFPLQSPLETGDIIGKFIFTGDLFFSGHVGLSFLMALVFWSEKRIRNIFIATSIIFAVSALIGHLHYSIDVFAAYYITYAIYKMAEQLFPKEYKILST